MSMNEIPRILNRTYTTDGTEPLTIGPIGHSILTSYSPFDKIGPNSYKWEKNPCNEVILEDRKPCALNLEIGENKVSNRRLVKVMIVDPDERVAVDKAVLINEPEKITDLDDQELFFELDIKNLIDNHNEVRASIVDKKMSTAEKTVYLEPIRVRDLTMLVLTIANF